MTCTDLLPLGPLDPVEASARRGLSPRPAAGQTFEPLEVDRASAHQGRVLVTAVAGDLVTVRDAQGESEQVSVDLLTTTHWIVRSAS